MKTKGIRILDKKNNVVSVELLDILQEIRGGSSFHWSILYIYTTGDLGPGKSIPDLEKEIIESKNGMKLSWDDLIDLSNKLWEIIDITIIASKNSSMIKRYEDDQAMYEKCDIVIEMIDSGYWEIFSNDMKLIDRMQEKFKETEHLDTDFEK